MHKFLKYLPTRLNAPAALLLTGLILTFSCKRNNYNTDISGINTGIRIHRLEKDLFSMDPDSIPENIDRLYERYGEFFDLYNFRVLNIGSARQLTYPDYLRTFLTNYLNYQVYRETMEVFPDLGGLEDTLSDAFARYMVHFPGMPVPRIYTFVSRFNRSIVTADGILAIGLDSYLGTDCEYYPRLGINQYQMQNMHPGRIPVDCMSGWAMTEFEYNDSTDNVLSRMIYNGKIACFARWMLPEVPDSVIMGFSAGQMEFCGKNEERMWEYLVEHKILFRTDRMSIQKFTGPGPFTRDFSPESPARAAVWIGWRIVEDYLKRNPDITLREMMEDVDYQKILTLSKYNP